MRCPRPRLVRGTTHPRSTSPRWSSGFTNNPTGFSLPHPFTTLYRVLCGFHWSRPPQRPRGAEPLGFGLDGGAGGVRGGVGHWWPHTAPTIRAERKQPDPTPHASPEPGGPVPGTKCHPRPDPPSTSFCFCPSPSERAASPQDFDTSNRPGRGKQAARTGGAPLPDVEQREIPASSDTFSATATPLWTRPPPRIGSTSGPADVAHLRRRSRTSRLRTRPLDCGRMLGAHPHDHSFDPNPQFRIANQFPKITKGELGRRASQSGSKGQRTGGAADPPVHCPLREDDYPLGISLDPSVTLKLALTC